MACFFCGSNENVKIFEGYDTCEKCFKNGDYIYKRPVQTETVVIAESIETIESVKSEIISIITDLEYDRHGGSFEETFEELKELYGKYFELSKGAE